MKIEFGGRRGVRGSRFFPGSFVKAFHAVAFEDPGWECPDPPSFPVSHHMSTWLPHRSRRSQPAGSDGAAGTKAEFHPLPPPLVNYCSSPLFLPPSLFISSTSGSYNIVCLQNQAEIDAEASGSCSLFVAFWQIDSSLTQK